MTPAPTASGALGEEARLPRVLLVVPPFHQVFIPALGVSLLKAALARAGIPCDVLYLNIRFAERIGAELYSHIAVGGSHPALAGEWVFAGDLFGDRAPEPQRYVDEVLLGRFADVYDRAFADRLMDARARAPAFLEEAVDRIARDRYILVGVSSTYQQNCASLALLQRIKARDPAVATVVGGANCEGQMGAAIHELFPSLDYVCSGEADHVFPELVRRLLAGESPHDLPGIFARGRPGPVGRATHAPMIRDLDRLPYPDYDDYFAQFGASSLAALTTPLVTFETSRGCWWGEKHHCTFCGLNGGGMQYRSKTGQRALDEIDFLIDRYGVRDLYAVDPILDLDYFNTMLAQLAGRPRPPQLFYETKANLTKGQLRLLARAGVGQIQPGVESFSTPILRLMRKGVTSLQNVRLLKWCAEIGIQVSWNFLFGFPGEDPSEYQRLAQLVPSLTHLHPPGGCSRIRLDRFSPNFNQAAAQGFVNVRAALAYRHVYAIAPADLDRLAYTFDCDYADGRQPDAYAAPLKDAVEGWREQAGASRLELSVEDDRAEIHDTRPTAVRSRTTLHGAGRLAYLALDAGNTTAGVRAELQAALEDGAPSLDQIVCWLEEWQRDRLVVREGARYLSLAINPAERVRLPVARFLDQLAESAP